jgi:AcrR family transcriptional regulator
VTVAPLDRRASRRAATRIEIVSAAWELARAEGLAGISMRDLGERVGMRAQSVYSYFASKDEIYDAMFAQGYREFNAWMTDATSGAPSPLEAIRSVAHRFFLFCTSDPVRYQLLFLRTLPGFVPSTESYALAVEAMESMSRDAMAIGFTDPETPDLATALFTGLVSQQIANDPGGDRWLRLVDRAARMLLVEVAPELLEPATSERKQDRS